MIFRGGKVFTTEGCVRVDAFTRRPGMIVADSIVGDIVHVTDLFTTLARFAGAKDRIPTERLSEGVDQSALARKVKIMAGEAMSSTTLTTNWN